MSIKPRTAGFFDLSKNVEFLFWKVANTTRGLLNYPRGRVESIANSILGSGNLVDITTTVRGFTCRQKKFRKGVFSEQIRCHTLKKKQKNFGLSNT